MFDIEKQKTLIQQIITSAVCIDDQLVSPYGNQAEGQDIAKSEELYLAFNRKSQCTLDIYSYKTKAEYDQIKDSLITNKNIVILDWELNEAANPKYNDTLTILCELCENSKLQFVDIYTQENDLCKIAFTIYCYFNEYKKRNISEPISRISEGLYEFIDSLGIEDFDADFVQKVEGNYLPDYLMNPKKRKDLEEQLLRDLSDKYKDITGKSDFQKTICEKYKIFSDEVSYKKKYTGFVEDYCLYRYSIIDSLPNKEFTAEVIDPTTIYVNGTVIHITSKSQTEPDKLMEEFTSAVVNLPMYRSLLLSLFVKQKVNSNLANVGCQLGKLNENVLLKHFETLSEAGEPEENIAIFITNTIIEHLKTSMINDPDILEFVGMLKKKEDESLSKLNPKDTLALNSMLTFISANNIHSEKHRLMTGDVFEVNKKIGGEDNTFIMCISKSCDTLRPSKINNNYAFVLGSLCSNNEIVKDAEELYYTYLDDGRTIKWSEKFMTIHITTTPFSMKSESRKFNFKYIEGEYEASYLGIQKELYAIRIMNNVFSNAMKVGVDLPHKL